MIREKALDKIDKIAEICKNPNWGEMDEIAVSNVTIEKTKKIIDLLDGENIPPEIDPTARGWIEFNWYSSKYVVAMRINDEDEQIGKTNMNNSSDKFYASKLFSNFCEKEVKELLKNLLNNL